MSSPLSHALANVMKRAAVIMVAMAYAHRAPSPLHLFGVSLSVFGALIYQQLHNCSSSGAAERDAERKEKERSVQDVVPLLPYDDPGPRASSGGGSGGGGVPVRV